LVLGGCIAEHNPTPCCLSVKNCRGGGVARKIAQHAAIYAAILKEHKLVRTAAEAKERRSGLSSSNDEDKRPTVSQAVGALLGKPTGKTEAERKWAIPVPCPI
jgi:hypothetical protein